MIGILIAQTIGTELIQEFHSALKCSILILEVNFISFLNNLKLSLQKFLQSLRLVNPFEYPHHFLYGGHLEPSDLKLLFRAIAILLEYSVHDFEHFFYSLVQSNILSCFDQQHVLFLIWSIYCDSPWFLLWLQSQQRMVEGFNKYFLPGFRFLKLSIGGSRNLNPSPIIGIILFIK